MTNRDQLTYYEGSFLGKPKTPSDETRERLQQLIKLDFLLGSRIAHLDLSEQKDIPSLTESLISKLQDGFSNLSKQSEPISDILAYEVIISCVKDWFVQIFKELKLSESEATLIRKALFENEFGRAGLSIVVDICCLILADALGVRAIHFAQGSGVPQNVEDIEEFKKKLTYLRLYFTSEGLPQPTQDKNMADSFTRCSFGELSIALIQKTEEVKPAVKNASLTKNLNISSAPYEENANKANELSEGINLENGLLYSLAKEITSLEN